MLKIRRLWDIAGNLTKKRGPLATARYVQMKAALPAVLLSSFALAACCTSTYPPEKTGRIDGEEAWSNTSVCGIFSGWGTKVQPERSEALYTPVTAAEYSRYICGLVDIEDYATCANRVERLYRDSLDDRNPQGDSASGPFAVLFEDDLYVGSYRSDAFSASFRVSSGSRICKGSYNAIYGDEDAVFDVWCDNGARGKARMVRDRYGRDGIGVVTMDDGAEGRIVFGPRIAEVARAALR